MNKLKLLEHCFNNHKYNSLLLFTQRSMSSGQIRIEPSYWKLIAVFLMLTILNTMMKNGTHWNENMIKILDYVSMTKVESIIEPHGVLDNFGWKTVAFVH